MRHVSFFTILSVLILSGCAASANLGSNAEENKTQTILLDTTDYDAAFRQAVQVAASENWSVKTSDREAGFFRAQTPSKLSAWSDEVQVMLNQKGSTIRVMVKSNLGQESNREIVATYLSKLKRKIADS